MKFVIVQAFVSFIYFLGDEQQPLILIQPFLIHGDVLAMVPASTTPAALTRCCWAIFHDSLAPL